ncbi:MAG: hypothetical protein ILO36_01710 [Abditibacteriota bacterium]|nr:hypothetical protein [Abditibacteriota bacterium]
MTVGVCGFGNTGSSAVSDFLKEYDSACVPDSAEFTIVCEPDGLADLAEKVMHPRMRNLDSVTAMIRYKRRCAEFARKCGSRGGDRRLIEASADRFLKEISQADWYWRDKTEYQLGFLNDVIKRRLLLRRLIPAAERLLGRPCNLWPRIRVSMSVQPEGFYEAAKKHVREMAEALGADFSKLVVLDQPFGGNDPRAGFPFFDDPCAIVSDRDPRDLYVFALTALRGKNSYMPLEKPSDFIAYYKNLRKDQPYGDDDRVLAVRFEDMVYNYEKTTEKIKGFLKLGENPRPKTLFDPARSVCNTQVFRRFPEYADAVREIEDALPEYLFDFSPYPVPQTNGKMFTGRTGRAT